MAKKLTCTTGRKRWPGHILRADFVWIEPTTIFAPPAQPPAIESVSWFSPPCEHFAVDGHHRIADAKNGGL